MAQFQELHNCLAAALVVGQVERIEDRKRKQAMWFPEVEKTSKILGLVGGAFTLAKTFSSWASDQSLERKITKTTERIGESLRHIRELEEPKSQVDDINLRLYVSQLRNSLKADLQGLESALDKKRRREEKRHREEKPVEVPKGIRTWLLFYWPGGFDGWLVLFLFYGCAVLLGILAWAALRDGKVFSKDFLVLAAVYSGVLLYLRRTALRFKVVSILRRIGHLDKINEDLGWIRRTLLLFKPAKEWAILQLIYYYLFVFGSLAMPFLLWRAGGSGSIYKPFFWEVSAILMALFLLCARVLAADALAWRFLGSSSTSEAAPPTTTSAGSTS